MTASTELVTSWRSETNVLATRKHFALIMTYGSMQIRARTFVLPMRIGGNGIWLYAGGAK
jgi:hypothetical protein